MSWKIIVPNHSLVDGKRYFLAWPQYMNGAIAEWRFWSRALNGKKIWSTKPGIAMKIVCDENLRSDLVSNPDWCAVEIPENAEKIWRKRKSA